LCNFSGQVLGEHKMVVRRAFAWLVVVCSCIATFAQIAGQNINMVSGTNWPAGDPFLQRQNEPSMAVSSRNPEHLMGGANDYRTVDIPNTLAPNILGDAWLGVYTSLDGGETWKSTLLPGYPQDTSSVGTSSPLHAYTVATDPTVRAGTNGMFYYSGLVFDRGTPAPSGVFVATFQDQDNKGNGDNAILTTTNGKTHGNPFAYVGATLIDSGTSGQFLDKPWIVVDIPRPGRTATCKVNGVTFSSGYIYLVYTQFNGSQNNPSSKIKEVTSTNCGATWSNPQILSQSQKLAQGTVAAIDPNNGNVYVAWRQIAVAGNPNQPDAMQWAVSTNGGSSFTYEPAAFTFAAPTSKNLYPPGSVFDQPQASNTNFRSLDVPTLAVDANSRVWMAFSERVNGATAGTYGSRIMITTLPKGSMTWTTPIFADSTYGSIQYPYGLQFMPSLNFAYGKMALAWFDSRRDNLESMLQCPANATCTGLSDLTARDVPIPGSTISNPASIFTPLISDPNAGIRHTIDVYGGIIDPSSGPKPFAGFQVSQYGYWVNPSDNNQIEQGFFNPPNLPMFVQGQQPFIGDYIDIASQNIIPSGSTWVFNTQGTDSTGATNAPDFHFTWTDNRDVVPPPVVGGAEDWTQYVPPNSGAGQPSTYFGTGSACPTCSTTQPACAPVKDDNGSPSAYSGDRNQNVYTSRVTNGLVVRFSENAKAPSKTFNRSFSLLVKNTVPPLKANPLGAPSFYRILLGVTSTSSAPACTVNGVTASLLPTTPNCYLDVAINPGTTLAQAVTLTRGSATASLNVLVAQEQAIPVGAANPVYTGLQALAVINSDPTNPSVADPDFTRADDSDPDVSTPYGNLPIATGEEYDPTVGGPPQADPSNSSVIFDVGSASVNQPSVCNTAVNPNCNPANNAPAVAVTTPRITTPRINSVQVVNPQIVNAITTPRITTPRITTPRIISPDITTPRITDLSDSTNPVTDYTWNVNNKGNTRASYNTQELVKASGVACCPAGCWPSNSSNAPKCQVTTGNPAGPNCSVCQLIQSKVYESPTPDRESSQGNPTCDLNIQQSYTTVANISDPSFTTTSASGNPSNAMSSTLSLGPGEGNRVVLRVVAQPVNNTVSSSFKTQAASLVPDSNGNPAGSLTITTGTLPVAVVGQNYYNTKLASVGGFGATFWTIPASLTNPVAVEPPPAPTSSEALPVSPLMLSPSGQISTDIVTASTGTYTVNMQVQDSAVSGTGANATPNAALDVQQVQLEVNQFTISNVNVAIVNEVGSTSYMKAGDVATIGVTISNQGPATATTVTPTITVNAVAGGTPLPPSPPVVTCGAPAPTNATMLGSTTQGFFFTCTAVSGNGYVTFTANASGQYVNAAATVVANATSVSQPTVTPSGAPPNIVVDTTQPLLQFNASMSPQSAPGWYNATVVVPYTTSDNLSGQYQLTPTSPATDNGLNAQGAGAMTLNSEGKPVTGTLTLSDFAKNSQLFTSAGYNIDETPPTVTGAAAPVANGNGWNNTPVTVTFTCTDPNPSNGPIGQQSGIRPGAAGCTSPVLLTAEAASQSATGTATDVASNSAQVTVNGINIDMTAPTIVGTPDRAPNANGWYNAPLTVSFACADPAPLPPNAGPASGVANCGAPVVLGQGANQSVPGMASDKAGNSAAVNVTGINIDTTPPAIVANSTYTPNVWTKQSVVVTFTCKDNLSGPTLNNPAVVGVPASGFTVTNSPGNPATTTVTLTAETAGTMLTANCQDLAGNNATAVQFGPIMIDKTPPTITATATANGNPYSAGSWTSQPPVVVTFSCTDSLSGVKPGSITANANYGSQGSYTANGSCQDNAGNTSTPYAFAVNIDTTVPGVMIASPSAQNYLLNQTITPSFTCPDNLVGGDNVTCTAAPSASPFAATPVGPGTFTVNAVDQAGNTANGNVNYLVVYNFTGFQAPLQAATASTAAVQSDSGSFTIGTTVPVAWQLQDANNTYITDITTLTSIVAYSNATCTGPASGAGTTLYNSSTNTSWLNIANNTFTFSWNTTGMTVGCYNLVVTTYDTLQWSTLVHLSQTFAVATPYAIAFDKTNMWVPSYVGNTVTELNASTGTMVGTYPVGSGADGVLFDGTNIWVANTIDGTVTKLSTGGTPLGTYTVGSQPWGIAFDGTNIWVTNRGSRNVTVLGASTGALVGTYQVGTGPYGIAFDGTNMWVANDNDGTVTELVAGTGALVGTYPVGSSPVGVAFDGTNIWVADQTNGVGTVTKLAPTGAMIGTYPAGPAPNDILFDGTNIWVTNNSSNTVTKLLASTGAIVGTYTVGAGPYGIAFDGTNIWATLPGSNSVTKTPVF
jgi:hypothetical protein